MSASIALMVEGATETALMPPLRLFLKERLLNRMPTLRAFPSHGRLPVADALRREVERLLRKYDHVVALTDVYTGSHPPMFRTGLDAREKMRAWVGANDRFHPHAAQHEFEAWLVPYWPTIQQLAKTTRPRPSLVPEAINHDRPPSQLLKDVFGTGPHRVDFQKILHSARILRGQDLTIAAQACPELRAFLNTILTLSGSDPI